MATKYRLLAPAFMDGAYREVGHIFELAEGVLGPHRAVVHGPDIVHHDGDRDGDREVGKAHDEPLYEEVTEAPTEVFGDAERMPSVADADWGARPEHGSSVADPNWPGQSVEPENEEYEDLEQEDSLAPEPKGKKKKKKK